MTRIIKEGVKAVLGCMAVVAMMAGFSSCKDEIASPPVIKITVVAGAATEVDPTAPVLVDAGTYVSYRFDIAANTTITDLKMIRYDVLSLDPEIKSPSETLVGGLTNKLNEVVEGGIIASDDVEFRLIVKDLDGNETSAAFQITVQ